MAPLYKDFSKDASDLLSKLYGESGLVIIESKVKGADNEVFINPGFDKAGAKVDVQYNVKKYGLKTKATIAQKTWMPDVTVTYETGPHSIEAAQGKQQLTYEYKAGAFAVQDRVTPKEVAASVAWECCKPAVIGAAAQFDLSTSTLTEIGAGFAYNSALGQVSIQATRAKGTMLYDTAVLAPIKVDFLKRWKIALTARCTHGSARVVAGTEFECPITKSTVRAKIDNTFVVTLAIIRKFANNWQGAVSIDSKTQKVGLRVICE